jgi:hypothetical protein
MFGLGARKFLRKIALLYAVGESFILIGKYLDGAKKILIVRVIPG